jgi:hypothetical protein
VIPEAAIIIPDMSNAMNFFFTYLCWGIRILTVRIEKLRKKRKVFFLP